MQSVNHIRSRVAWTRLVIAAVFVVSSFMTWRTAHADTMPTLFSSFAGNVNFIGTQRTLRTLPDRSGSTDSCQINAGATAATLSGLPAGATIRAAYLYWAASGDVPDYTVTFEGTTVVSPAARSYTSTFPGVAPALNYFSGAADVTGLVAAKGNGSYSLSGLTVDNSNNWCQYSAVLGGWALLVVYSHPSEDFRVINIYEGFQYFQGSSITLTPSNFQIPSSPINGKNAHLTWEGDLSITAANNGFTESLRFNGTPLTDATNPAGNQFNSASTINAPPDSASYGVDFDVFDVSAYLAAGQTSATTVYSSGQDLVMLSAQVISTTNVPVGDLEIAMTRNGNIVPGQNASYTLDVTNNGPLAEPGPITVVDTLPAGLTYVSGTGTGWSCSASGQTVTCTRSGSLANGAVTASLTITAAVSAGAAGTITNTATVSGQAFDNVSWNNTASDSVYILPTPYAYYAMDEATWGAVADSSGNGRDASVLGGATATGYPPASPPGSAIAGNPGTCGAGFVPATAGTQGVSTPVDPNAMGNAGTIAFWYNSSTAWNDGNDRMLFDASNNLGGNDATDKHFYLVKGDSGRLRFAFENSADANFEARDGTSRTFAANTWHHIAVTWNVGTDVARLYLDGVQVATSAATTGSLGDTNTLYFGDLRVAATGDISGTPGDYSTNSANGYIDEVRVYPAALVAADVAAVRNLTHPCNVLHHVRIEHGSGSSLTCNSTTLTVRACANASCSSPYTGGITGNLTNSGTPTVNWIGGAGFTIAMGASNTTKDVHVTTPGSVVFGTSGVNPAPSGSSPVCNFGSPACTFTAASAGFVFDVPNHTADTTQNVVVSAVQTSDVTQRCVPAFQSVTKTVNFWSTYLNPATGTLAVDVNGGNIAGSSPGTSRNLAFDANGQVTIQVRYPDVGNMRLSASHSGAGTAAGLVMTGQDTFVTKPARFVLTIPGNPAAANASGGVFKRAGENFTMTVAAQNASNAVTPNYGNESTPETLRLTKSIVAPAAGNNPGLNGGFGAFGLDCSGNPAAAGTACGTFNWPEVGIISLTPGVGDSDYLGAGDVTGLNSGNIGRFTPDHFRTTPAHGCATFTYSGQPFGVTVTAYSSLGGITQNFDGTLGFAKQTTISNGGASNPGTFGNNAIPAADFASGTRTHTGMTYTFAAKETSPLVLPNGLILRATDTDNVSSSGFTEGNTEVRSGRLAISSAYGSELVTLPMTMQVQSFDSATGWSRSGDTCTTLTLAPLANFQGNLNAGETCVQDTGNPGLSGQGCTTAAPVLERFIEPPTGGTFNLNLQAPGSGNDGSADVTVDLSALSWMRFDWDGNGVHDNDPRGRATFGLYKGSPRHIYLRERY